MHVRVDGAGSGDEPFTTDDGGARADDEIDVVLHVGVAGPAHPADAPFADADRRLADATRGVDDDHVGDDDVARLLHCGSLQHQAVASGLAEPGEELVAALLRVVLDLDDEAGVAQSHTVADRGTVDGGVVVRQDLVGVRVAVRHTAVLVAVLELTVGVLAHDAAPR